jgi:ABC-type nitrate/sulfonate/bicarbonate transport system permease component
VARRLLPLLLLALALGALAPAAVPAGAEPTPDAPFARGREIPPPVFVASLVALGLLVQATRLLTGRAVVLARGLTTLLVFLGAWELAVSVGLVTTILLPPPTVVLQRLDSLWLNGYLLWHLLSTLRRFLLSFALAAATAFPVGVLLASVPRAFAWLDPVITFLRMIPSPAWAPIAILWLGLGDPPAIFIVWLAVFFPIFLNTVRGVHDVLPIYREVIRTLGGGRRDEILRATVPCALPAVLTGLRVGFGLGWVVLAAAELIAVDSGLGWLIQTAYTQVDSPAVLGAMTLICWMGVLFDAGLRQLERRLVAW